MIILPLLCVQSCVTAGCFATNFMETNLWTIFALNKFHPKEFLNSNMKIGSINVCKALERKQAILLPVISHISKQRRPSVSVTFERKPGELRCEIFAIYPLILNCEIGCKI